MSSRLEVKQDQGQEMVFHSVSYKPHSDVAMPWCIVGLLVSSMSDELLSKYCLF